MGKNIIIVGGFHEIIELCEELGYSIIGIIDNKLKGQYLGYQIIGSDKEANQLFNEFKKTPLVITPDSPAVREKLFKLYSNIGFKFETVLSKRAKISKSASIGIGTIIQDGVNISANTKIGEFVKLNIGCNIMHDCVIRNYVTIAPNAVILGRIIINRKTYVGANATILPEKQIAENVIIGAGALVSKDIIEDNTVHIGVPAKKMQK